jgi:hypothetical protein
MGPGHHSYRKMADPKRVYLSLASKWWVFARRLKQRVIVNVALTALFF